MSSLASEILTQLGSDSHVRTHTRMQACLWGLDLVFLPHPMANTDSPAFTMQSIETEEVGGGVAYMPIFVQVVGEGRKTPKASSL